MTDMAAAESVPLPEPATPIDPGPKLIKRSRFGTLGLGGVLSAAWLILISGSAILAPWLPIKDPDLIDFANVNQLPNKPPGTPGFLLGTEQNSFDILSRIIWGGRVSLVVALGVLAIGMVVGGGIGLISGFLRGKTEMVLMSIVDVFLAFPALILLIAIVAFLCADLKNVVIGISLVSIPAFARIARATTLTFSQREFVLAAEAAGATKRRILIREILPNVVLPLLAFLGADLKNVVIGISLVSIPAFARIARATTLTFSQREFVLAAEAAGATKRRILIREILPNVVLPLLAFGLLVVGIAIVAEGSLAFLGLTSQETISWGGMINGGKRALQQENIAHTAMIPAFVMFLTVLSVNMLGDRFRAAFDVKDTAL